jgi:EpsI family protein
LSPIAGRDGWNRVPGDISSWRPDISGASAELRQTFGRNGTRVGLHIALFRDQTQSAKAVTSQNQLVSTTNKRWEQVGDGTISTMVGGLSFRPRTAVVTDRRERLAAWQWFWVDGRVTSSELLAKWYEVLAVLRGHGDPVAWVIISTPTERGEAQARATLQAFTADMRVSIDAALRQAATE